MSYTTELPTSAELRVWVGCLACYNSGRLTGKWVPALTAESVTSSDIHDRDMTHWERSRDEVGRYRLRRVERHEELWCFDQELGPWHRGELSPADAQAIAESVEWLEDNHYGTQLPAVFAWLDNEGMTVSAFPDEQRNFDDSYCGEWSSEREFSDEEAENYGFFNGDDGARYFDWDAFHTDTFTFGDHWSVPAIGGGVHVFRTI